MKKRSLLILFFIPLLCFFCLYGCSFRSDPKVEPSSVSDAPDTPINHGTYYSYEYDEYQDHVILTASSSKESVVWLPGVINNKPVVGFGTIFAKNFKLTTINIPGNVQTIDERAFYMCDHLSTVNISDGLKSIGKEAFSGCSSLSVAKIPASVTSIADDAFLYCMNLVIFGEQGSTAQEFAARFQSINFRPVEPETTAGAKGSATEEEQASETTTAEETTTANETTTVKETTTKAPATAAPTAPPTAPPTAAPTEPPAPPTETTAEETTIPDNQIEV